MKPRLILHVGLHKTGTTAIQARAGVLRGKFRRAGVLYPDLVEDLPDVFPGQARGFRQAHHHLFHALAGDPRFLTEEKVEELLLKWQLFCVNSGSDLFLSSESISRHALPVASPCDRLDGCERYLFKVARLLGRYFEVETYAVLRRHDDFARSLYQEKIMRGSLRGNASLDDFVAARPERFDYPALLGRLETAFGMVNVKAYESLISDGDICGGFFDWVHPRLGRIAQRAVGPAVRSSLTPQLTMLKLALNEYMPFGDPLPHRSEALPPHRLNKALLDWLRSEPVIAAMQPIFEGRSPGLWVGGSVARLEFMESVVSQLAVLADRYELEFPAGMHDRKGEDFIGFVDQKQMASLLAEIAFQGSVAPRRDGEDQAKRRRPSLVGFVRRFLGSIAGLRDG